MLLKDNEEGIYSLRPINKRSERLANHKECFNPKAAHKYFKGLAHRTSYITNKR